MSGAVCGTMSNAGIADRSGSCLSVRFDRRRQDRCLRTSFPPLMPPLQTGTGKSCLEAGTFPAPRVSAVGGQHPGDGHGDSGHRKACQRDIRRWHRRLAQKAIPAGRPRGRGGQDRTAATAPACKECRKPPGAEAPSGLDRHAMMSGLRVVAVDVTPIVPPVSLP